MPPTTGALLVGVRGEPYHSAVISAELSGLCTCPLAGDAFAFARAGVGKTLPSARCALIMAPRTAFTEGGAFFVSLELCLAQYVAACFMALAQAVRSACPNSGTCFLAAFARSGAGTRVVTPAKATKNCMFNRTVSSMSVCGSKRTMLSACFLQMSSRSFSSFTLFCLGSFLWSDILGRGAPAGAAGAARANASQNRAKAAWAPSNPFRRRGSLAEEPLAVRQNRAHVGPTESARKKNAESPRKRIRQFRRPMLGP